VDYSYSNPSGLLLFKKRFNDQNYRFEKLTYLKFNINWLRKIPKGFNVDKKNIPEIRQPRSG
jgi:hypothetical protein